MSLNISAYTRSLFFYVVVCKFIILINVGLVWREWYELYLSNGNRNKHQWVIGEIKSAVANEFSANKPEWTALFRLWRLCSVRSLLDGFPASYDTYLPHCVMIGIIQFVFGKQYLHKMWFEIYIYFVQTTVTHPVAVWTREENITMVYSIKV